MIFCWGHSFYRSKWKTKFHKVETGHQTFAESVVKRAANSKLKPQGRDGDSTDGAISVKSDFGSVFDTSGLDVGRCAFFGFQVFAIALQVLVCMPQGFTTFLYHADAPLHSNVTGPSQSMQLKTVVAASIAVVSFTVLEKVPGT